MSATPDTKKSSFPLSILISSKEELALLPQAMLAAEIAGLHLKLQDKERNAAEVGNLRTENATLSQQLKKTQAEEARLKSALQNKEGEAAETVKLRTENAQLSQQLQESKAQVAKDKDMLEEASEEIKVLREILFPDGLSEEAYFEDISERAKSGGLDDSGRKRMPLLLLLAGLQYAASGGRLPDFLKFAGNTIALVESDKGAKAIRSKENSEWMNKLAEWCNRVCKKLGTDYRVIVPALGDSTNTGWMDVSEAGQAQSIIKSIHNWAVKCNDKTVSKASVSCK